MLIDILLLPLTRCLHAESRGQDDGECQHHKALAQFVEDGLASMPTKATVAIWPYMRRPLGQPHCSRNLIGADPERQEQIRNNQLPAPYRFVRSQRLTSSWPINFFAMSSVRLPAGSNLLAAAAIMTSG